MGHGFYGGGGGVVEDEVPVVEVRGGCAAMIWQEDRWPCSVGLHLELGCGGSSA